jgi:hypothetical protein
MTDRWCPACSVRCRSCVGPRRDAWLAFLDDSAIALVRRSGRGKASPAPRPDRYRRSGTAPQPFLMRFAQDRTVVGPRGSSLRSPRCHPSRRRPAFGPSRQPSGPSPVAENRWSRTPARPSRASSASRTSLGGPPGRYPSTWRGRDRHAPDSPHRASPRADVSASRAPRRDPEEVAANNIAIRPASAAAKIAACRS